MEDPSKDSSNKILGGIGGALFGVGTANVTAHVKGHKAGVIAVKQTRDTITRHLKSIKRTSAITKAQKAAVAMSRNPNQVMMTAYKFGGGPAAKKILSKKPLFMLGGAAIGSALVGLNEKNKQEAPEMLDAVEKGLKKSASFKMAYINKYAEKRKKEKKYDYFKSLGGGLLGNAAAKVVVHPLAKRMKSVSPNSQASFKDKVPKDTAESVAKLRKAMKVPKSTLLTNYSVLNAPHFVPPYKNNAASVNLPKGSKLSVYGHEFGHASGIGANKHYAKASAKMRRAGALGATGAFFAPTGSKAEMAGYGLFAASQISTLGEESRASIRALKGMKKAGLKGGKSTLAKGLGSYAAASGMRSIVAYSIYKGKRLFPNKGKEK
tara:strand:+ start:19 stop:1152 length:1134 start_codon:yes stop_codon:yes gene_type:complete